MTPISIYVHIPYCLRKCPYCDFNSHGVGLKGLSAQTEERYIRALIAEARSYFACAAFNGRPTETVFLGGGTPSLFSSASIALVLDELNRLFPFSRHCEVTLEANPGTIQEELGRTKLIQFRNAGINRISLGCQSFNAAKLSFLGRIHSAEDIPRAVSAVRAAGFDNLNLDLIYGVRDESLADWAGDLNKAAELQPEHISAYTLTIEQNTEFGVRADRGETFSEPDERQADLYEYTVSRLAELGYDQYEVSNFSRPGRRCEHNWRYWHASEYLGLGAGSHSHTREAQGFGKRWSNCRAPAVYLDQIETSGRAVEFEETIDKPAALIEFLYLRLRCNEGFTEAEYEAELGRPFLCAQRETVQRLEEQELLQNVGDRVKLTTRGFLVMDSVLEALFE